MSAKKSTAVTSGDGGSGEPAVAAGIRIRLDNLTKFDGTKAGFAKYNIKVKAAIRNNGCGNVMDLTSDEIVALRSTVPAKRSAEDKLLVSQANALYIC